MRSVAVIVLALLIVATIAQGDFKASVTITSTTISGRISGVFYFSRSLKATRLTYNSGYDEVAKYDTSNVNSLFVYKKCPNKCDVVPQALDVVLPAIYWDSTDSCASTATPYLFGTCFVCTKKDTTSKIQSVCLENMTTKKVVRATFIDGNVYDFSNIVASVDASVYSAVDSWGCKLSCISALDIVLIVDESDSISGNYIPGVIDSGDWKQMRLFTRKFVDGFEIAADKIHMGLVQFARGSHSIILTDPFITSDSTAYNSLINGLTKSICGWNNPNDWNRVSSAMVCRGNTWTGTGFLLAAKILLNTAGTRALRKDVAKVIFIVTDGNDNNYNPFTYDGVSWSNRNPIQWADYVRNSGITVVSVGVGSGISIDFLNSISSKDKSGKSLAYLASTYNQLTSDELVNTLGRTVCTASGTVPVECPKCRGQCVCGSCVCPDSCDNGDACTVGACNSTYSDGGGCLYQKKVCNDNSYCTTDTCDSVKGCVFTNITCEDGKKCTIDTCDPKIGCKRTDKICTNSSNKCLNSTCDESTGACTPANDICTSSNPCTVSHCDQLNANCNYTAKDCTYGNLCNLPNCDVTKGCLNLTKNCDDGNVCSIDKCGSDGFCVNDPINCDDEDACTIDTCDAADGCKNERINATEICNDGNSCTIDTCDKVKGCIHTNVTCIQEYTNPCIITLCDPIQGCLSVPKICPVSNKRCFVGVCTNSTGACSQVEVESCRLERLAAITTASVLSAGIIAAIVIAAVVFTGGVVGGAVALNQFVFKGEFTNTNALYQPETQTVSNPAFNRNSVFQTPPQGNN